VIYSTRLWAIIQNLKKNVVCFWSILTYIYCTGKGGHAPEIQRRGRGRTPRFRDWRGSSLLIRLLPPRLSRAAHAFCKNQGAGVPEPRRGGSGAYPPLQWYTFKSCMKVLSCNFYEKYMLFHMINMSVRAKLTLFKQFKIHNILLNFHFLRILKLT